MYDQGLGITLQWILANTKMTLGIIFMIARTYEHGILLFFIQFQQGFKLQNLEVEKSTYQRVELKSSKVCKFGTFLVCIPMVCINTVALYR